MGSLQRDNAMSGELNQKERKALIQSYYNNKASTYGLEYHTSIAGKYFLKQKLKLLQEYLPVRGVISIVTVSKPPEENFRKFLSLKGLMNVFLLIPLPKRSYAGISWSTYPIWTQP